MEAEFEAAAARMTNKGEANNQIEASQDDRLRLYGLFKQITEGDNTSPKPGMFNLKAKLKWEAYEVCKGMSKEEAMKEYIALANQIVPPP
mmetsp:Transcript_6412/g.9613  ORF Transcript_6412/g.9613 Transcript_6412/m.9613 type:complete len:90 (+) Transcript_6412:77-346(+)